MKNNEYIKDLEEIKKFIKDLADANSDKLTKTTCFIIEQLNAKIRLTKEKYK